MKAKLFIFILSAFCTMMNYAQTITYPKCTRNSQGLITMNNCPTNHPQISVSHSEDATRLTIFLNGKLFQKLYREDSFYTDEWNVHYLDANFDGHCDIVVGPCDSRTYSTLLLWNKTKKKFEPVGEYGDPSLQHLMLDPVNKLVYEGGGCSWCILGAGKSKWINGKLVEVENLTVVTEPSEYSNNDVRNKYTIKRSDDDELIKSTEDARNLPSEWRRVVKTLKWDR